MPLLAHSHVCSIVEDDRASREEIVEVVPVSAKYVVAVSKARREGKVVILLLLDMLTCAPRYPDGNLIAR